MTEKRLSSVRPPVRPPPPEARPKNRLLAALPADDFRRLLPHLTTVPLRARQVLRRRGEAIHRVFFPNGGACSVIGVLSTGAMVECSTVGDEGMLGIEAFLSDHPVALGESIVQVPDTGAVVLSVEEFRRELQENGALHNLMRLYIQTVLTQMMDLAVCNAFHDARQRCARWLLMMHDRMHEETFNLSQEFLAMMLGVRRPTVSAVAETLQEAGLIHYAYGHITVQDRKGLEAAACECYPVIRAHFDWLRQ